MYVQCQEYKINENELQYYESKKLTFCCMSCSFISALFLRFLGVDLQEVSGSVEFMLALWSSDADISAGMSTSEIKEREFKRLCKVQNTTYQIKMC